MNNLLKNIFGYCDLHGWFKYPYKFRSNTEYINEEDNYETGCHQCEIESNEYWDSAWDSVFGCGPKIGIENISRPKWMCFIFDLVCLGGRYNKR